MKVLITGANGLIGGKFYQFFEKHHDVIGTYCNNSKEGLKYLNLENKKSIEDLFDEAKPDIVIHSAGIADPDKCELQKDLATRINKTGTEYITDACLRYNSLLVFLSTSHVFNNGLIKDNDEKNPVNFYGQLKSDSEDYINQTLKNSIILRPPKVYGYNENCPDFTRKVLHKLTEGKEIELDNLIKYYPVLADDLVGLTQKLIDEGIYGTYNISSHKPYTKFEWAGLIAESFGLDKTKIKPIKEENVAKRQPDLYFDTKKIQRLNFFPTELNEGTEIVKNQKGCSFNMIYEFHPNKIINGTSTYQLRIELGKALAREEKYDLSDIDMVVPLPQTGLYTAQGYAAESKIPLLIPIIINPNSEKRTLYEPNVDERMRKIRKKLEIIPDLVKGKNMIIVDEAIVAGCTLADIIEKLESAGANEIHVRIPAPIMINHCKYNILSNAAQLVAEKYREMDQEGIEAKLKEHFNVASIKFLSQKSFMEILPDKNSACLHCWK